MSSSSEDGIEGRSDLKRGQSLKDSHMYYPPRPDDDDDVFDRMQDL